MNIEEFIEKYEELLNNGYCECNELNCLDNNTPRKILEILKKQDKEIDRQKEVINGMIENEEKYLLEINKLKSIIKEVREYIENNSLYEQDYDYDYEENMVEYPPSDEQARKDILEILDKVGDEK